MPSSNDFKLCDRVSIIIFIVQKGNGRERGKVHEQVHEQVMTRAEIEIQCSRIWICVPRHNRILNSFRRVLEEWRRLTFCCKRQVLISVYGRFLLISASHLGFLTISCGFPLSRYEFRGQNKSICWYCLWTKYKLKNLILLKERIWCQYRNLWILFNFWNSPLQSWVWMWKEAQHLLSG